MPALTLHFDFHQLQMVFIMRIFADFATPKAL